MNALCTLTKEWNCAMQGLMRWLARQYATYDEFSFWRTEARRDHSKLLEQVEYLKHQVNELSAKIGPSSPCCTPTIIIDEILSPDVVSRPKRPSESPGTVAASHGQGLRKAPRKDLEECFNECDDPVPQTQIPPNRLARGMKSTGTTSRVPKQVRLAPAAKSPRSLSRARAELRLVVGLKSPETLSRGPKYSRQGHTPQRDPATTSASLHGNVKRAKGKNGGEGKLDSEIDFQKCNYVHVRGPFEHHCFECLHFSFQMWPHEFVWVKCRGVC